MKQVKYTSDGVENVPTIRNTTIIRFVSVIVFIGMVILSFITSMPSKEVKMLKPGQIIRFYKDTKYFGRITEIIEGNKCVFVLYDDLGIVQCYDLHGDYLSSVGFHQGRQNGRAEIKIDAAGNLVILNRGYNAYVIEKAEDADCKDFRYYDSPSAEEIVYSDDNHISEGNRYFISLASIKKESSIGETSTFLFRPWYYVIVQNQFLQLSITIVAFALFVFLLHRTRPEAADGS